MEKNYKFVSDLKTPIVFALHEGRVCFVGRNLRKRILYKGERGGLFFKMNGKRQYLSAGGHIVVSNVVRPVKQ